MTYIDKIIMAFVVVQVALVLAKPYEPEVNDKDHSNDNMEDFVLKRATDCGSDCIPEGCFIRKCRSSCLHGEDHILIYDNRCGRGLKCCVCFSSSRCSGCRVDM